MKSPKKLEPTATSENRSAVLAVSETKEPHRERPGINEGIRHDLGVRLN